jgi:hypothetical protein
MIMRIITINLVARGSKVSGKTATQNQIWTTLLLKKRMERVMATILMATNLMIKTTTTTTTTTITIMLSLKKLKGR